MVDECLCMHPILAQDLECVLSSLYERIKIDSWTTTAALRKNNTAFVIYKYIETCGTITCRVDISSTDLIAVSYQP